MGPDYVMARLHHKKGSKSGKNIFWENRKCHSLTCPETKLQNLIEWHPAKLGKTDRNGPGFKDPFRLLLGAVGLLRPSTIRNRKNTLSN